MIQSQSCILNTEGTPSIATEPSDYEQIGGSFDNGVNRKEVKWPGKGSVPGPFANFFSLSFPLSLAAISSETAEARYALKPMPSRKAEMSVLAVWAGLI